MEKLPSWNHHARRVTMPTPGGATFPHCRAATRGGSIGKPLTSRLPQ